MTQTALKKNTDLNTVTCDLRSGRFVSFLVLHSVGVAIIAPIIAPMTAPDSKTTQIGPVHAHNPAQLALAGG